VLWQHGLCPALHAHVLGEGQKGHQQHARALPRELLVPQNQDDGDGCCRHRDPVPAVRAGQELTSLEADELSGISLGIPIFKAVVVQDTLPLASLAFVSPRPNEEDCNKNTKTN